MQNENVSLRQQLDDFRNNFANRTSSETSDEKFTMMFNSLKNDHEKVVYNTGQDYFVPICFIHIHCNILEKLDYTSDVMHIDIFFL